MADKRHLRAELDPAEAIDPEEAFETLSEGMGRRDLLRAASAIGAGAVVPAWTLSPGATGALAASHEAAGTRILEDGRGRRVGHYIALNPRNVSWGYLPNRDAQPSSPSTRAR